MPLKHKMDKYVSLYSQKVESGRLYERRKMQNKAKEMEGDMQPTGVIKRPEWVIKTCPFCFQKLSAVEFLKRKTTKMCTCTHCKKTIDERHAKW